jgi:hypothetical protein
MKRTRSAALDQLAAELRRQMDGPKLAPGTFRIRVATPDDVRAFFSEPCTCERCKAEKRGDA